MTAQHQNWLTGAYVEKAICFVFTGSDQGLVIQKAYALHRAAMTQDVLCYRLALDIPDVCRAVCTAGGDEMAVRTE